MEDGKWNVVGKAKPKTKAQKQEIINKMPKVQDLGVGPRLATMIDDDGYQPLRDASNTQDTAAAKPVSRPTKKSKKPPAEPKYNYKTIEEALRLDDSSLEDNLVRLQDKFPDNPNIWLKDTASQLNINLRCPEDSATFSGHKFDYPLCKAPKSTYNMLMKLFGSDMNDSIILVMYQHCLNSMQDCIARDVPSWGYRLCIQALAHSHPDVCCQDLPKYQEKICTMQNAPKRCLSILWALGQTGFNDNNCGMKVWLEVMLPNLHMKNMSQYAMSYIETIMKRMDGKPLPPQMSDILTAEQFLQIAKWTFDPPRAKNSVSIRDRMKDIYPTFRTIATDNASKKRQIFVLFLKSSEQKSQAFNNELIDITIECLKTDQHCYKLWRDSYTSALITTKLFLEYLLNNWDSVFKKLQRNSLKETIRAFVNTNTDAESTSDPITSKPEFNEVRAMCEEMSMRLSDPTRQATPFMRLIITAVLIAAVAFAVGHVTYDIQSHGGVWEKSQTYRFLKSKGVITVATHVQARVKYFTEVSSSWIHENVPYYWNTACDVLGPYLWELVSAFKSLFHWLVQATEPFRTWLAENFDTFTNLIINQSKFIALRLLEVLDICFDYARIAAVKFAEIAVICYQELYKVINGEVDWSKLPGEAYDVALEVYAHVRNMLYNFASAIGEYVAPDKL